MTDEPTNGVRGARITAEVVAALAAATGLHLTPERLPLVTDALRELHEMSAAMDDLPLDDLTPETSFDAGWASEA